MPDAVLNRLCFANAQMLMLTINREDECLSDIERLETGYYLNKTNEIHARSLKPSLRNKIISNIKEFTGCVARIAPNAKNVEIRFGDNDVRYRSAFETYSEHVLDLFKYGPSSSLKVMYPAYNWDIKHPLSNLDIYRLGNYNNCSEIIMRNAGTLKSLTLMFKDEETFENIWDIFGYRDNVVYPNVHKLHLDNQVHEWVNSAPSIGIDSDSAPFPALRCLETLRNYAITDNVLFRGNENTLAKINISVHEEWVHVLKDIFSQRNCDQIKYMRLELKPYRGLCSRIYEEPVYDDFIKTLPSLLVKLCFKVDSMPNCFLSGEQYSKLTRLQVLTFENADLTLETVCGILSANPMLKEIHVANFVLDQQFKRNL